MNDTRSGGGRWVLLPLLLFLLLAPPSLSGASESCAMMGGTCRPACGANETAEAGAFEDCGPKDECCVGRAAARVQCCIASLEAKDFGPANCTVPANNACPAGSPSPAPCAMLQMCAPLR